MCLDIKECNIIINYSCGKSEDNVYYTNSTYTMLSYKSNDEMFMQVREKF